MIPAGEGSPPKLHEIDFYSFPDNILSKSLKKGFLRLQLIEGGENKIHAKNSNGFLLQQIRGIPQVYVQQEIVRGAAWLQLKSKTHPAIGVVRPGVIARRDGIGAR